MDSSDTPLPVASPQSPQPPSPRSGLDSLLSKLPGTAVVLYALHLLQPVLLSAVTQCADQQRWRWVLVGFLVPVVPTLAWNVYATLRRSLAKPPSSPP